MNHFYFTSTAWLVDIILRPYRQPLRITSTRNGLHKKVTTQSHQNLRVRASCKRFAHTCRDSRMDAIVAFLSWRLSKSLSLKKIWTFYSPRVTRKSLLKSTPNNDNQFLRRHWFPPNELADEMRTKVSMLIIQVITDNCAEDDASRGPLNEAYQIHARELDGRQTITRKAEARALRAREKSEADRRTKLESLQDRKENVDDDDDYDLEVGLEVMQEKTQEKTSWTKKTKPTIGVENTSTRRGRTFDFLEKPWNNKPKPTTTPPTTSRYFSGTGKKVGGDTLGDSLAGKPATRGTQLMGSKSLMQRFERSRGKALLSNAVGGEEQAAQATTPPKPASDNRSTLQALLAKSRAETRRRAAETSIDKYFTKSKAPVETVAMDAEE